MNEPPTTAHLELNHSGGQRYIALPSTAICRFGRGPDNTVVVNDQLVSRNHALIDCRGRGQYFLTDLKSRNGTLLNGVRVVTPMRLTDGDQITVGEQVFVFRNPVRTPTRAESGHHRIDPTVVLVSLEIITALVVDIRDYTSLSRALGAEKISAVISAMFQQADAVLRRNDVWVQKYIGDAIMAIWKHAPGESNARVLRSVFSSTVELFRIVAGLSEQFSLDTPVHIGAGINTGLASLGNMGGDGAADYTALGDTVNKAFRLESATRGAECHILVGDRTWEWLSAEMRTDEFEKREVPLKGYPDPQPAFSITVQKLEELLDRTEHATA